MPPHPSEPDSAAAPSKGSLRVALCVYRGNPFSGGLGVYVRRLSTALTGLGHRVTVFSGQPYARVDDAVALEPLPSLDLYREPDPFRRPALRELRDGIDVLEFAMMLTGAFPEPLTFSLRARRALLRRPGDFDVVHDNAGLGYGLLDVARRLPAVATVHHAVEIDRAAQLARARTLRTQFGYRRFYGFVRMQARVARRLPAVITVSESSRDDIVRHSGVDRSRLRVVGNGVDAACFRPLEDVARVQGRIVTTASADVAVKGLAYLLEALAKLRTERHDAHLVVVGRPRTDGGTPELLDRLGLRDAVRFVSGIGDDELAAEYARAQVAVVPSLYEGFSLPAVEAMACAVPLVCTTGGALPEVAGRDGETALLVPPADAGALAAAVGRVLDDGALAERLGAAGRRRVLERYTWERSAAATAEVYREVIALRAAGRM